MGNLASSQAFLKIEKTNREFEMGFGAENRRHGVWHPALPLYRPQYDWGQDW
jgi:hypothetical protein